MFRIEFKIRKISETLHVFKKYNDRSAKKISHVTSTDVTAKIAGHKKYGVQRVYGGTRRKCGLISRIIYFSECDTVMLRVYIVCKQCIHITGGCMAEIFLEWKSPDTVFTFIGVA